MDSKGLSCQEGVVNVTHSWQGGQNGSFVSRRGGGCSSAWGFVLCRIAERTEYPRRARFGKLALARLGLHACCHTLGISRAMLEPRPFLPRCGRSTDSLARGPRRRALLVAHRRLLHRTRRAAGGGLPRA